MVLRHLVERRRLEQEEARRALGERSARLEAAPRELALERIEAERLELGCRAVAAEVELRRGRRVGRAVGGRLALPARHRALGPPRLKVGLRGGEHLAERHQRLRPPEEAAPVLVERRHVPPVSRRPRRRRRRREDVGASLEVRAVVDPLGALEVEVHLVQRVHVDEAPLRLLAREAVLVAVGREHLGEQRLLVRLRARRDRELAVVLADPLELLVERGEDRAARHRVDLVAPRAVGVLVQGRQLHTLARVRVKQRGHHLVAGNLISTLQLRGRHITQLPIHGLLENFDVLMQRARLLEYGARHRSLPSPPALQPAPPPPRPLAEASIATTQASRLGAASSGRYICQ